MLNSINYLDDYICGNKFVELCDYKIDTNDFQIQPDLLKGNKFVFVKTDKLKDFFDIVRNLPYKYIIISHNSDHNINEERYSWKPDNVIHWFAQNVLVDKDDITPIPIGIENIGVGQSGNVKDFQNNLSKKISKNKLMYVCQSDGTNKKRGILRNYFSQFNWITNRQNRIPFPNFLAELSEHKYVLSPPGNGEDCHRTWEAYYSNTIPICEDTSHNKFFSKLLPMILYKDFSDITDKYLEEKYTEIQSKLDKNEYTLQALRFDWWKNYINFYVKNSLNR